jgi:hypothetical protein
VNLGSILKGLRLLSEKERGDAGFGFTPFTLNAFYKDKQM